MITTPSRVRTLNQLTDLILQVHRPHPLRVAIDGVDAAGKTVLADELAPFIEKRGRPVIRASIDGFHRPRAERYHRGDSSPEGYFHDSFDYPAILESLLLPLGPSGNRNYRTAIFDFLTDSPNREPFRLASVDAVLLLDGVFLLRSELLEHWDFRIFLDVDFEVAVSRAMSRDLPPYDSPDSAQTRYWTRYVPGQRLYLQDALPQKFANIVIDNNDLENPKIKLYPNIKVESG